MEGRDLCHEQQLPIWLGQEEEAELVAGQGKEEACCRAFWMLVCDRVYSKYMFGGVRQ